MVRTSVYANFASGDEIAEDMYGGKERVERLKAFEEGVGSEGDV